jgi:hypothetical protein
MEHSTKSAASTSNWRSTASSCNANVEHDAPPSHFCDPTNHATPQQSASTTPDVARRKRECGRLSPQLLQRRSGLGAASIFATPVPVRCIFAQSSTNGSASTADHVTSATCAGDLKCRIPSAITVCTCASKSSRSSSWSTKLSSFCNSTSDASHGRAKCSRRKPWCWRSGSGPNAASTPMKRVLC